MNNDKIHIVISITRLNEAEKEHINTAEVVGPYIEALNTDNWEQFYDKVGETLPTAGDNEDIFLDICSNGEGKIVNFDLLTDELVSAFAHITDEIKVFRLPTDNYEVVESKKLDSNSVIITMLKKTE